MEAILKETSAKVSLGEPQARVAEDEVAFYDALEVNDSAAKVLGDECLALIAHELLETIRANVTIDWTAKESVRAKSRVMGETHLAEMRLSARQAGKGNANRS